MSKNPFPKLQKKLSGDLLAKSAGIGYKGAKQRAGCGWRVGKKPVVSDKVEFRHQDLLLGKARVLADRKRRRELPYRSLIIVK
jgi:hypothetical protein